MLLAAERRLITPFSIYFLDNFLEKKLTRMEVVVAA
jgi:hypothetical protein